MPWEARERFILLVAVALIAGAGPIAADDDSGSDEQASMAELIEAGLVEPVLADERFLEREGFLDEQGNLSVIVQFAEPTPLALAKTQLASTLQQADHTIAERNELGIIHAASYELDHDAVETVARVPAVEKVWLNHRVEPTLQDSVPLIGADEVWTHSGDTSEGSLNDLPLTGEGVVVSVIDSGITYDHQEFGGCGDVNATGHSINYSECEKIVDGWDHVDDDDDPFDEDGHGTHVAGIVGANGVELSGTASGIQFSVYRVTEDGVGDEDDMIAAIENSAEAEADVISMSVGKVCSRSSDSDACPSGTDPLSQAADNASSLGVTVVAAAGNDGPSKSSIASPGTASGAITVGATCNVGYCPVDEIVGFSSRGPTGDGRTKPDVVAPGYKINSTDLSVGYEEKYGTSMATPHVSGVVALMLQAHPDWTPEEVKAELRNSTIVPDDMKQHLDGERGPDTDAYAYGWGRIDALRALDTGPPSTSISLDGERGNDGWFTSSVAAMVALTDPLDPLGITTGPREVYAYHGGELLVENVTLNGLAPEAALTAEATIAEDGEHELTAHGVDNGGNEAANTTWTVKFDQTPPESEASLSPAGDATEVRLSGHDNTSGLARLEHRIDEAPWETYEEPFVAQQGATVAYRGVDVAGNVEDEHVFDVPNVSFASPSEGNVTIATEAGSVEQPLPAPANDLTSGAAVTVGTVTFELAIGAEHSNATAATITVTDEAGATVDVVELAYDYTRDDGRHVWSASWQPPAERSLERLTAGADVENTAGAHAGAAIDLVTVGEPEALAQTHAHLVPVPGR